jgi:hypothetical protein
VILIVGQKTSLAANKNLPDGVVRNGRDVCVGRRNLNLDGPRLIDM